MFERRHWIPPLGFAFGLLCHGLSWVLALWIALRVGVSAFSPAEIAWIHLVALGWITVTALSVLLHAIPSFFELAWRYETLARNALFVSALAIAAFVVSLLWARPAVGVVATLLAVALLTYLATAWATLQPAFRSSERAERAVARAFTVTFAALATAIVLGGMIAWLAAGARVPEAFVQLPPAHANLALFGWLTLLVYGMSARTLRPITGNRSSWRALHIVVGTTTLAGAPLLAIGSAMHVGWVLWFGGALVAAGAGAYATDTIALLLRATVAHRAPQAFVGAGVAWLLVAMLLGAGVLAGMPWQGAFGFTMLMGWVGQLVNGHVFHIGVRLIATIVRGDDDETRPQQLLDSRWSFCTFALMQGAIVIVLIGLIRGDSRTVAFGAVLGLIGWVAMVGALANARVQATRPQDLVAG